ncbi:MAG: hypothetical protein EBZ69_03355 [Alphaproteobacteria bacterium]|nr:hypothetical protein [Alphaproteobacteria bacterium]NDC55838.1 hypothetical protein [Alphaproteobacteria bacterium]NDG03997.1 hypothetical protein [Alphaproteobacteria bacterium]
MKVFLRIICLILLQCSINLSAMQAHALENETLKLTPTINRSQPQLRLMGLDNLPQQLKLAKQRQRFDMATLSWAGWDVSLAVGNPYRDTVEGFWRGSNKFYEYSLFTRLSTQVGAATLYAGAGYQPRQFVQKSLPLREVVMAQSGLIYRVTDSLHLGLGYDFASAAKQGKIIDSSSGLAYVGYQATKNLNLQFYQSINLAGDDADQGVRARLSFKF